MSIALCAGRWRSLLRGGEVALRSHGRCCEVRLVVQCTMRQIATAARLRRSPNAVTKSKTLTRPSIYLRNSNSSRVNSSTRFNTFTRNTRSVRNNVEQTDRRLPASQRFTLLGLKEINNIGKRGKPITSFSEAKMSTEVKEAVLATIRSSFAQDSMSISPTEIQAYALPVLLCAQEQGITSVMLAAETGTGKTIAYLAPLFERLKQEEQRYKDWIGNTDSTTTATTTPVIVNPPQTTGTSPPISIAVKRALATQMRRAGYPRSIVLAPSHDLVSQIALVAKQMSHIARVRVAGITTSTPSTHLKRVFEDPIDVLVTTPGALTSFMREGTIQLTEVQVLVVDEADTIFDQGFDRETREVIEQITRITATKQKGTLTRRYNNNTNWRDNSIIDPLFIFVTATLPKSLFGTLNALFSTLKTITTPSLHRPLINCKQHFIDVSKDFRSDKHNALLYVLREFTVPGTNTLVFCNTRKSVETTESYLRQKLSTGPDGVILALTGSQKLEERADVWVNFQQHMNRVLVCTDIASRGVDTVNVGLVINFDFPTTVIDYLHRIGRTARAGRKGVAVSLATRRSRDLVAEINKKLRTRKGL